MEWREQSTVSCDVAFAEAQRWVEEVTRKTFGGRHFRSALENGVLLCDLINRIKPGIIKRVNRLSTPIAGLDNINVFLKACGKLGLKEAQLFHPGDLQDLSSRVTVNQEETSRRLKNVLITIYWLGRKAQVDPFYNGPHLNLKAFEGLLGIALSKALEESSGPKRSVRDSGFGDGWYAEREEPYALQSAHRREASLDSLDSVESRTLSISSEATLKGSSEGCSSDAEADHRSGTMADGKDLLQFRRSQAIEPRTATQFNQFLPSKDKPAAYVPAPLRKKRADRHEDNRRSWASPMYTEEDGTFTRLLQKRSGRDGSKSVEDIPESPVLRQVRYEDLQRIRAQVKECEDKWQDDLTRWKNRRRSINSDIVKKKEERDQMELIASGSSTRRSRTFGEVQEERDSREQDTLGSNGNMLSSSSVQDPASEIRPLAKIQLGQNYTINTTPTQGPDTPAPQSGPTQQLFSSALPSDSPASLSDGPASLTDGPALSSISPAPLMSAPPPSAQNSTDRGADTKRPSSSTEISASFSNQILAAQPAERSPSPPYAHRSMEAKPGTARVSVSLPRSYQRSDGSRLTSVVTPRPFGTQATRISSLPRSFIMDDSHKRFNGEAGTAHRASVPSRYSQFLTSEDETRSQSSSVQSSNEDEEEEEHQEELGPPPPSSSSNPGTSEVVPQPTMVSQLSTTTDGDGPQEYYSDMRISLNQKPNSSRDFGFQTSWDSTGARVKSVQPGSPAELCRLQVGDVVLAVGGRRVSDMSYDEWKGSLEAALQHGSLVMDVRRHGKNAWDSEPPSLPFKSHKTINLTSVDPTLVGGPEKHVISSLERNSGTLSAETPTKTEERRIQPVNDLPAKGVNGGFRDESVTVRHKEHESISLRNLKRRSEFFEQKGGSDSAISDLQVPSLSTTSNRWSWDPEEERRRQEKWQKEQERLLQEKYKRDQEKLEEEWKRAQQEVAKEDSGSKEDQKILQLESRSSITFSSHQVPLSESTPPSLEEDQWEAAREWEEEERCRREQEEWRQKEQEERRQRERQEEEDRRRFQGIEEEQESHRLQEQQQWEKSKSTPELDDVDKPAKRVSGGEGTWSRDSQRKRSTPLSQAELERQQILQEMKKKTQLLTDSSWIRQRSTSVINKEPVNLGGHIRRGESLDNLDSARPWRPLSWSSVSASSAPSYSRPHSSLSTLSSASSLGYARSGAATLPSSYSTGSLRQSPWSQPPSASPTPPGAPAEEPAPESRPPSQQRTRSVSGRKMCTLCDLPLGKGAAMIIESLGLCYHLSCFKCISCKSDLGGSESGAEVRIRNRQLYCNSCYIRIKSGQPTSM
ncbi:LIM domain only protein 7 isoform X1 [Scleropages formosus]|uniref:LIM domain only protein 7 isoform X1 n=1 Tax=Scleropages formosus TaxID=113540 RepID=UPI0010FA77C2|nr:LIM domain only protein 7 isoform X1 [Scleropages formosus]